MYDTRFRTFSAIGGLDLKGKFIRVIGLQAFNCRIKFLICFSLDEAKVFLEEAFLVFGWIKWHPGRVTIDIQNTGSILKHFVPMVLLEF